MCLCVPVCVCLSLLFCSRDPDALFAWVERVTRWDFERVVPAHLDAPLRVGPEALAATFREAFGRGRNEVRACDEDVQFLRKAEQGPLNFSVYKSPLGTLSGKNGECGLRQTQSQA